MFKQLNIKFLFVLLLLQFRSIAQVDGVFTVEDDMMLLHLQKKFSKGQCDSISKLFALPTISLDTLFREKKLAKFSKEGWKLKSIDEYTAVLMRPLSEISNTQDWSKNAILLSNIYHFNHKMAGTPGYPTEVVYGRNKFKQKVTVRQRVAGVALFWLPEHKNAQAVYLSGNFNDWSLSGTPMKLTDSGWVAQVNLEPGKYFYKFIVDGNWIEDSFNELKEYDGHGGNNSTYYQSNFTFRLKGYKSADKVNVAGSFNKWNGDELRMLRTSEGWIANMYLQEGIHTYKFIVDGQWILDPENKLLRPDGEGNFNSVVGNGDTVFFKLNVYAKANQVILAGNFNNWRNNELMLNKSGDGWLLSYMLPPGNYEYKYIIDGNWITDPGNVFTCQRGEDLNSVLALKPNYVFRLKKYLNAKNVYLTGAFNDWAEPGYKMYQKNGEWVFPINLKPGKYTYKFIVDGKWILDPGNKIWEENEFGTNNSVLWIESESKK